MKLVFLSKCVEKRIFEAAFVDSLKRDSNGRLQRNVSVMGIVTPFAANIILVLSASGGGKDSRLRETEPLMLLFWESGPPQFNCLFEIQVTRLRQALDPYIAARGRRSDRRS